MIVHVILPGESRFQFTYPDDYAEDKILRQLDREKGLFGCNRTVTRTDATFDRPIETDFPDPSSGWAFDNPLTAVVIVDQDGKELKRLKGPAPKQLESKPDPVRTAKPAAPTPVVREDK